MRTVNTIPFRVTKPLMVRKHWNKRTQSYILNKEASDYAKSSERAKSAIAMQALKAKCIAMEMIEQSTFIGVVR